MLVCWGFGLGDGADLRLENLACVISRWCFHELVADRRSEAGTASCGWG